MSIEGEEMTDVDELTLDEMSHIMLYLNGITDCEICTSARKKLERMIHKKLDDNVPENLRILGVVSIDKVHEDELLG